MNSKTNAKGNLPLSRIALRLVLALTLAAAMISIPAHAQQQKAERSGKEVVAAACGTCHITGKDNAPKIGDKQAWDKLESQGLTSLTEAALRGIRQMPSHGGNPHLTDTEIQRAITYMVNQSGGHWIEPTSKTQPAAERNGEQIVEAQCARCHLTGTGGAPKIGDRDAWVPRLVNGLDATVRSAINGHGAMPARGGLANLTDAEVRLAIIYMFSKTDAPPKGK